VARSGVGLSPALSLGAESVGRHLVVGSVIVRRKLVAPGHPKRPAGSDPLEEIHWERPAGESPARVGRVGPREGSARRVRERGVVSGAPEAAVDPERRRLVEAEQGVPWRRFGPYLAERAWGSVREDYSADGDAWSYLTYEDARSTAYRWNEDGMGGISDDQGLLCLAPVLWNGRDPYPKERMFGLANAEGNHGEDVKECFWYEDATPTASWLRWRYWYPVAAFPYDDLRAENARRGRDAPEYELFDTGVLDEGIFDCVLEVAKATPEDLHWRLTVTNRSPAPAELHVLPTVWCRNTWRWGRDGRRPEISAAGPTTALVAHPSLGRFGLRFDVTAAQATSPRPPTLLFCENETNTRLRYGTEGPAYPKDGIADHVCRGLKTVNPAHVGTKAALWWRGEVPSGAAVVVTARLVRLAPDERPEALEGTDPEVFVARRHEADLFFDGLRPRRAAEHRETSDPAAPSGVGELSPSDRLVVRQALAGLVWGQCFYHYNVARWLAGDPAMPPPPAGRGAIRNGGWRHLDVREVLSMPDAWEYPWFAAWDLAFHTVPFALIDPAFAKAQLVALAREWYMHPNGQFPAYEWNFSDVNPPVHAWAALEVFNATGSSDNVFLARIFHKLLLNFTWWVNQEDALGNNVFEGGFLGMDNIGPFDRSHRPPVDGRLEQSDGTAWMAMYCLDLLQMALHLAFEDRSYEDVAVKFFEHFVRIAEAMSRELWDDDDGFFYDVLRLPSGDRVPLRVRSLSGLVSLAATRVIRPEVLEALPEFATRVAWYRSHRLDPSCSVVTEGEDGSLLLAVVTPDRLERVLGRLFDEAEFLSPYGVRSLSAAHREAPYQAEVGGVTLGPVDYEPGESRTGLFGGNSNWRGPIWLPLNHLLVTALRRYGDFLGESRRIPVPSGGGSPLTVSEAGDELARRLVALYRPGPDGRPPAAGQRPWPEGLLWFHEYFHGDTGEGLGASHQTGWTALLADLVLRHNRPA